jgi:hypothetical protein
LPPGAPEGYTGFGPGYRQDARNPPLRFGRFNNSKPKLYRLPFSPFGIESLTRFAKTDEGPADYSARNQRLSTRVGKVTHPSGAPDNHLLCVWSPGPVNGGYTVHQPAVDGGIYVIKEGKAIDEPGQMLLIKNEKQYNEQWPRAVVPYRRIYGVKEPKQLAALQNDGKLSPHLPAGTPLGLVGTSSLYKRESYPNGLVKEGSVTATFSGKEDRTEGYQDLDPFNPTKEGSSLNWFNQGADAGRYANDEIHAIRILAMEPTTDRNRGPKAGVTFRSHAQERLRILGEIPVRKFSGDKQPNDPDGNPDTSFLAKIPADVAYTFQTLDRHGMVLNMAQTWHQVRPGEIRNDCGGCHAHSQKPTLFAETAAAKADYPVFDLSEQTPLLTTKANDRSGKKWDKDDATGLRYEKGVKNIEFHRDIRPILERSCVACHSGKSGDPAGNLVLDDDRIVKLPNADDVPGTYYRLTMDYAGRFGHKPLNGAWRGQNASRYVRMFQSRRSLLIWKVFGKRMDGWSNDDFPTETTPGNAQTLKQKGEAVASTITNRNRADLDYTGSVMPPPDAVKSGKVHALSDEDRLTLVRWIDLGCPIDLDHDSAKPSATGYGWMLDDQRPTLTMASPQAGANEAFERILIGAHDYGGLDRESLSVVADFGIDGVEAGKNLASRFKEISSGIWELKFEKPMRVTLGKLLVTIRDRQGNTTRIERTFWAE